MSITSQRSLAEEASSYPLSKTLDPGRDYVELAGELKVVDPLFTADREQHEHRRFEYALAIRALRVWTRQTAAQTRRLVDVGGDGSPFTRMANAEGWLPVIVDPACGANLSDYLASRPCLADAVICLSVLEHVDALDDFLYHLGCLVAPGGLLVLTFDYCDNDREIDPPDRYHFHWMRKRIFGRLTLEERIVHPLCDLHQFRLLGGFDWRWGGPQVYDYTFASLALVKRA